MSKRGGFPGGGIPGSYQNMLKQAQRMQNQMQQARESLDAQEFTAAAGGGAVTVTLTGDKHLKKIEIAKEAVDPDDVETLQDMITAAFNEAMKQVEDKTQELFGGMM